MRKRNSDESRESNLASGWTVEAGEALSAPEITHDSARVADENPGSDAQESPGQLPNIALVFLGVMGGISLLYAWIWLSWAQYYATSNAQAAGSAGSLGSALQQFVFWLSPLAPLLWFTAAVLLNRGRLGRMVLWVLIGAVITFPLPALGGVGA